MSDDRRRIPEFYKLSVEERLRAVRERGLVTGSDFRALATGRHTLDLESADKMVENVVGVMGLPLGLGMNLVVKGRRYLVPMAVEEPSVIAALGSASKLIAEHGGFEADATDPILIGQIQVLDLPDMEAAKAALVERKQDIMNLANSFHPNMVARGGGARDMRPLFCLFRRDLCGELGAYLLRSHFLLFDTCRSNVRWLVLIRTPGEMIPLLFVLLHQCNVGAGW